MKFGPVLVADAVGAILAHGVKASARIPKGTVLTAAHVADLAACGFDKVTVARLGPDDMGEDAAAAMLAQALVPDPAGSKLRVTAAATGRVNIYATGNGVIDFDPAMVAAFNAVHPMITLATLPRYQRVAADTMVATIKIISYAVPEQDVAQVAAVVAPCFRVLPPVFASATLIETRTMPDIPPVKGRDVTHGRLHRMGLTLSDRVVVAHEEVALGAAIQDAPGEVILVLTASATSDAYDVAPQAVRQAGGEVIAFGMPVDPGNLLFLGQLGDKPVIGLPGCARSPALNGADWVLERVICGIKMGPADFAALGVGGLLKEIPSRPKPRADIPG